MSPLTTRLTEQLGIAHPVLSAPMAVAGGGRLAAAVSAAGGLGLIGGGYGDADWIEAQVAMAGHQAVGVGFITWALARSPHLLDQALAHQPRAVMLSFGDPAPFADQIRGAGAQLICQCQTLIHVEQALACGADIIVAQGAEAGGHGQTRATFTLVPEVADRIAAHGSRALLVAAGGVADGRGLAAALMLGADGVLLGTRLWASAEADVSPRHQAAILATGGDGTLRTRLPDIARQIDWPPGFTARIRRNAFTDRWEGRADDLLANVATEGPLYRQAFAEGDPEQTGVWFGEAAGLIHDLPPAAQILETMVADAAARLTGGAAGWVTGTP